MNKDFKLPPASPKLLTSPSTLAENLSALVGQPFNLTGKTRTDGSNNRKLIASTLENFKLPDIANVSDFEIVPPKKKGLPKITREFIDTYMVTSGTSYNLQVWNRIPASDTLLVSVCKKTLHFQEKSKIFLSIFCMKASQLTLAE